MWAIVDWERREKKKKNVLNELRSIRFACLVDEPNCD